MGEGNGKIPNCPGLGKVPFKCICKGKPNGITICEPDGANHCWTDNSCRGIPEPAKCGAGVTDKPCICRKKTCKAGDICKKGKCVKGGKPMPELRSISKPKPEHVREEMDVGYAPSSRLNGIESKLMM